MKLIEASDVSSLELPVCNFQEWRERYEPEILAGENSSANSKFLPASHPESAQATASQLTEIAIRAWSSRRKGAVPLPVIMQPSLLAEVREVLHEDLRAAFDANLARRNWAAAWFNLESMMADAPEDFDLERQYLLKVTRAALAAASKNRSEDLVELCQACLTHGKRERAVVVMLARALTRQERFEEALPHWNQLAQEEPAGVEAWLNIARCCNRLNLIAQGLETARIVLDKESDHVEAAKLMESFLARSEARIH